MAFADPQSVTINAVAFSLPRVAGGDPQRNAIYRHVDGNVELKISQNSTTSRFRREFRVTQKKVATDPISAQNKELSASVILAIDEPRWGFSLVEKQQLAAAMVLYFTNANRDKLLSGEF